MYVASTTELEEMCDADFRATELPDAWQQRFEITVSGYVVVR